MKPSPPLVPAAAQRRRAGPDCGGNGKQRPGFPAVPVPSGGKSLGGSNPGRDEEGGGAAAASPGRSLLRPARCPFPGPSAVLARRCRAPEHRGAGAGAGPCQGGLRVQGEARRGRAAAGPAGTRCAPRESRPGGGGDVYMCVYMCVYMRMCVCVRGLLSVRAASPPAFRFLTGFTWVLLGECWCQTQGSQAPEAKRTFVLKSALLLHRIPFTLVRLKKCIGKLQGNSRE